MKDRVTVIVIGIVAIIGIYFIASTSAECAAKGGVLVKSYISGLPTCTK